MVYAADSKSAVKTCKFKSCHTHLCPYDGMVDVVALEAAVLEACEFKSHYGHLFFYCSRCMVYGIIKSQCLERIFIMQLLIGLCVGIFVGIIVPVCACKLLSRFHVAK